jgi:predicted nucleic acid-binding protein
VDRKWVLNASPLIVFGKISAIHLLEEICSDLVIPEGVAMELHQGPDNDPARIWMHGSGISLVRRLDEVPPLIMAWDLGKGESEVISWAHIHPEYEAILDDRAARNCASSLGIRVRGTLGIILLAKKIGLLPQIGPLLDRIMECGFRIDSELLRTVQELADEG